MLSFALLNQKGGRLLAMGAGAVPLVSCVFYVKDIKSVAFVQIRATIGVIAIAVSDNNGIVMEKTHFPIHFIIIFL